MPDISIKHQSNVAVAHLNPTEKVYTVIFVYLEFNHLLAAFLGLTNVFPYHVRRVLECVDMPIMTSLDELHVISSNSTGEIFLLWCSSGRSCLW
jgi:hypothetical protein